MEIMETMEIMEIMGSVQITEIMGSVQITEIMETVGSGVKMVILEMCQLANVYAFPGSIG